MGMGVYARDLPSGSRCGDHWAIHEATPRAVSLARRLAVAFPQTGLWPVLWTWEDDPDAYISSGSDPARADGLDVHDVLQKVWNGPLPPLAPRSKGTPPPDPFGVLQRADAGVLVLVPVNPPADVASVLGIAASTEFSDERGSGPAAGERADGVRARPDRAGRDGGGRPRAAHARLLALRLA
jgi:hypothetical protein